MISSDQKVLLGHKHGVPYGQVDRIAMDVHLMFRHAMDMTDCVAERSIEREKEAGRFHSAALLWFTYQAAKKKLSEHDATDLLVALAAGKS